MPRALCQSRDRGGAGPRVMSAQAQSNSSPIPRVASNPTILLPRNEYEAPGRASGDRSRDRPWTSVEWQFRVAAGELSAPWRKTNQPRRRGHRSARLCRGIPEHNFLPLARVDPRHELQGRGGPFSVRIDTGFAAGDSVTPYYDPMIAKVIVQVGEPRRSSGRAPEGARPPRHQRAQDPSRFPCARFMRSRDPPPEQSTPDTYRRPSRAAWGPSRIRRTNKPSTPPVQLLLERRDEGRASRLDPVDPWRVADSFELIGSRRIAVDVTVDGVPMRVHLVEGANVDPVTEGEDSEEVSFHEANGGMYAFAGG